MDYLRELEEADLFLYLADLANRPVWEPNPGKQTEAFESKADVLFYGGAAGGGKTDLALGLAYCNHHRAAIFRRVYPNLKDVIERSKELFRDIDGARFNESLHRWTFGHGKTIEFESCQHEDDALKQRGRPRDLYVFDEVPEFSQSQFEFITGWLRTTRTDQRTRIVCTFNPPTGSDGVWVLDMIRPWLAHLYPHKYDHPNPALPGELRWYATIAGEQVECDGPEPIKFDGESIKPSSRTFIPANLDDNPYLADGQYRQRLQSLPEPLRSQLLFGDFGAESIRDPWLVIPKDWVRQAQARWLEMEKPSMPISGVGVDLVRGGKDSFALAKRYGRWFDEVYTIPGVDVNDGPAAAQLVYEELKHERVGYINMDVIGIGSSPYDSVKAIYPDEAIDFNVARGSTYEFEDQDGNVIFRMANTRSEMYWKMREALDPITGDNIALPPGAEVLNDLCAARYFLLAGGVGSSKAPVVKIEAKEDIKAKLGRSPDVGEAIMMANIRPNESDYVYTYTTG